MPLLLKNATFINWKSFEFSKVHILVEEGSHGQLKFFKPEEGIPADFVGETLDCSGKYVTKSFAVGHHHVYSALARGMPAPAQKPGNFREILQYIWWNLDKALDRDSIRASAMATAMACAKAGTTFIIDHHASPYAIEGSLGIIAEEFEKVGLSHLLCYEVTDRDGPERTQKGLDENERHLSAAQGLVGLHASFTVGEKTLEAAVKLAEKYNTGLHVHVAEDLFDQEHCMAQYKKKVVERYAAYGILNIPKTILVHGLHLDENERKLISLGKAFVAQNMESNLKNKVGLFNGKGLPADRIMLGTDGMHSDMLQSAKAAFFAGQQTDTIDFSSAYKRFRNVHHYLQVNGFEGDGENNLVVLNYDSPTPFGQDNFLGHFLFGIRSNHVQHVIAKGKLIVRNHELCTVNEQECLTFACQQAERLWGKL